jgi:hypothetical protein
VSEWVTVYDMHVEVLTTSLLVRNEGKYDGYCGVSE